MAEEQFRLNDLNLDELENVLSFIPLRQRYKMREVHPTLATGLLRTIKRVALMNGQYSTPAARRGNDHDIKRHNLDIVWVTPQLMPNVMQFLRACTNLTDLVCWRLNSQHLQHFPQLRDIFANLRVLELEHCDEAYYEIEPEPFVARLGAVLAMPKRLWVFKYETSRVGGWPNLDKHVQSLIINNPELRVLKLVEDRPQNTWHLDLCSPLVSLNFGILSTLNFWRSLVLTSRHSLKSFTSHHFNWYQYVQVQQFYSLQLFRGHYVHPIPTDREMVFPYEHLNIFALYSNQQMPYEHFLGLANIQNLYVLDLTRVSIRMADSLRDICRHAPRLRVFRFHARVEFSNSIKCALQRLHLLEELQIHSGYSMIPLDAQGNQMPQVMDARLAEVITRCTRLRVIVCIGGAGNQVVNVMTQRALQNRKYWYYIDLDDPEQFNDYPHNLKWIERYPAWRSVFQGFYGDYFDWKKLREVRE